MLALPKLEKTAAIDTVLQFLREMYG